MEPSEALSTAAQIAILSAVSGKGDASGGGNQLLRILGGLLAQSGGNEHWLHREVLKKLAENCGKVPAEFLS
jgi:hypothetical protein